MPFTLSHIALSLPLKKIFGRLSLTGLIIGSILPDIEFYLRMRMYGTWGNSIQAIIIYQLPIGILIAFCFHSYIRDQLIMHAPDFIGKRWAYVLGFDWTEYFKRNTIVITLSLLAGIGTHLFWDLLCHEQGYILDITLSFLDQKINGITLFDWNQLVLSIIGLILLLVILIRGGSNSLIEYQKKNRGTKIKYWLFVFGLAAMIYSIRVLMGVPDEKVIFQHMVFVTSAFFLSLLLVSMVYTLIIDKTKSN